jgi:hypothetical protein
VKTKTALFILGGGLALTAIVLYLRRQVKLALEWDYKIKNITVTDLTKTSAKLEGVITFENKSNLQAKVLGYDLSFFYAGNLLGNTKSTNQFIVFPDTSFDVPIKGDLLFTGLKASALPFVNAIVQRKPIEIQIDGEVEFEIAGIRKKLPLEMVDYIYSADLAGELGLGEKLDSAKLKLGNLLGITI